MPNWCRNELRVDGPAKDVKAFVKAVRGKESELPRYKMSAAEAKMYADLDKGKKKEPDTLLAFWKIVPPPAGILAEGYDKAGYDWEKEAWGCKWGACNSEITYECPGIVEYVFETPWCPPEAFFSKVAAMFPTLDFHLDFSEEDMGVGGSLDWKGGEVDEYAEKQTVVVYKKGQKPADENEVEQPVKAVKAAKRDPVEEIVDSLES